MTHPMRLLWLAIFMGLIAGSVQAESATLNLRLDVPLSCAITSTDMTEAAQGRVRLYLNCNASDYSLIMGGELADLNLISASSNQAQINLNDKSIRVKSQRPGQYAIDLAYDQPLSGITAIEAQIQPL